MNAREFAERALLGVLLSEPARIGELAGWLLPEDFYRPAHQMIYRELRDMANNAQPPADHAPAGDSDHGTQGRPARYAVTVYDRIRARGELGADAITAPQLVTLIQTAPPPSIAQPEQYALMVVEASIRRDLARDGLHVAQVAESADLPHILDTVDKALGAVEHAHQRWRHVIRPPATRPQLLVDTFDTPVPPAQQAAVTGRPELVELPSAERLLQAEHDLVGSALAGHVPLDALAGRVLAEDFADPRAAASYRAMLRVHTAAAASGRQVDPVTVAWQQQRDQARHGPGFDPATLLTLANTPTPAHPMYSAELILRGSVARRTRAAAAAVQTAAQHPALQPHELLRLARDAYKAVTAAADRMTGRTAPPAQLAQLATPTPLTETLRHTAAQSGSASAQPDGPRWPRQRGRPPRPTHTTSRDTGREA